MTDEPRRRERPQRTCPSCRVRWHVGYNWSPNYDLLPIDKQLWGKLRQAAEAFDRHASNLDEEEGSSGAGDGQFYSAAEFVEWIKADCEGYKLKRIPLSDGPPTVGGGHRAAARHPYPLPFHHRKDVA